MVYDQYPHGFETQRMNGLTGITGGPWANIYVPGGFTDGTTVFTRPGLVHSIIVERPYVTAVGGTSNILVIDWPDTLVATGPPVSGDTALALIPNGPASKGSFTIPVFFQCRRGMLLRFENLAPSTGLIAVVYAAFGRHDFIQAR